MDTSFKSERPDLSKTADKLSQHTEDLKQNATQVVHDVQEHAYASAEYASSVTKEQLENGFNVLNSYVQANPVTTILVASTFGYFIGWLRNK